MRLVHVLVVDFLSPAEAFVNGISDRLPGCADAPEERLDKPKEAPQRLHREFVPRSGSKRYESGEDGELLGPLGQHHRVVYLDGDLCGANR